MQRKLERFYDRFQPRNISISGNTACLEYSENHHEPLNRQNSVAMRRKEWDAIYTYLGESKPA
jgi:hypothetical protein